MSDSKYTISIETKADGSGVEQTESKLKNLSPVLEQLGEQFKDFKSTLAAGFQLEIGAKLAEFLIEIPAKLREAVHAAVEYADEVRNMALETNLTTESFQVLAEALQRNGANQQILVMGLQQLREHTLGALTGNKQYAESFESLGINAREFSTLPVPEQLEAIAKAAQNAGWNSEALNAIAELLGNRTAPRLMGVLHELAAGGFAELRTEAQNTVGVLNDGVITAVHDTGVAWEESGTTWKNAAVQMVNAFKPVIDFFASLTKISAQVFDLMVEGWQRVAAAAGATAAWIAAKFNGEKQTFGEAWDIGQQSVDESRAPGNKKDKGDTSTAAQGDRYKKEKENADAEKAATKAAAEKTRLDAELESIAKQQAALQADALAPAEKLLLIQQQLAEAKAKAAAGPQNADGKKSAEELQVEQQKLNLYVAQLGKQEELAQKAVEAAKKAAEKKQLDENIYNLETAKIEATAAGDTQRAAALDLEIKREQELVRLGAGATAAVDARIGAMRQEETNKQALAALDIKAIPLQEDLKQIEKDRQEINQSTLLDSLTKQERLTANTEDYKKVLTAIIALDEQKTETTNDPKKLAELQAEIARLKKELANADHKDHQPTKAEVTQKNYDNINSPTNSYQGAGEAVQGGAMEFMSSVGSSANSAAAAVNGTLNGALNATSGLLKNLMSGAMTWKQAWHSAVSSVAQSFEQAAADMVAKEIWRVTIGAMLSKTEVATHVAGEAHKTTATATGSASRKGIHVVETVFHGIQVAIRTAAHIASEIAATAATIAQSGIRIVAIIAESVVYIIKAAAGALSALASIPYVGPILAIAAMAAVLAAGYSMISKRAMGGSATANQPIIVGDGGRSEVFVPTTDGTIIPSLQAFAGLAGAAQDKLGARGAALNQAAGQAQAARAIAAAPSQSQAPAQPVQMGDNHFYLDEASLRQRILRHPDTRAHITKIQDDNQKNRYG
jgi:hypothetical protein